MSLPCVVKEQYVDRLCRADLDLLLSMQKSLMATELTKPYKIRELYTAPLS